MGTGQQKIKEHWLCWKFKHDGNATHNNPSWGLKLEAKTKR